MMNLSRFCLVLLLGAWPGLAIWMSPQSVKSPERNTAIATPFQKSLLKVAAQYRTWGRVDDQMRWAPWLCIQTSPGLAYASASSDNCTHGQKLYSLFVRKREAYMPLAKSAPAGQVIVKQSWVPEEITDPKERPSKDLDFKKVVQTSDPVGEADRYYDRDHFYPYVWKGEKVFKAKKQADLFIMMKFDRTTPGTDAGWVYGTVTPDGKEVIAAGKLDSCIKCHAEAKNDRLFGLPK
jgi:hypothetical protein